MKKSTHSRSKKGNAHKKQLPHHKPYKKGYLAVGDGHKIYYECCGSKEKPPVLFLHGGPGGGFHDKDKDFFDLKKWNLIIFDQRGAGRSKPFASTKANTTDHLVADINKLLDYLKIDKTFIFGGSWGSTLGLVYAIRNKQRVTGMLLRGIYLATREADRFYVQGGVGNFFPEEYQELIDLVPKSERNDVMGYYLKMMRHKDVKTQDKYAMAWSNYEGSILRLRMKTSPFDKKMSKAIGILEVHYLSQGCFIPENYILKNAQVLSKGVHPMPISIVQGRYDVICPPIAAWQLKKVIPEARLHFTIAGHSSSDPETKALLKKEMRRFSRMK